MKVEIPQQLKADMPQTTFGKILSATPVVMAVVATMLAGLASSEMTRAQYARSLGAQQQSKAGDQWSFFQAKRLRGAYQQSSTELLQNLVEIRPLDPKAIRQAAEQAAAQSAQPADAKAGADLVALLDSPVGQQTLALLEKGEVPSAGAPPALDPKVQAALAGLDELKPDADMAALLAPVTEQMLQDALIAARDQAQAFDAATKPVNQAIEKIQTLLTRVASGAGTGAVVRGAGVSLSRDFTVERLRYTARRYEVEARVNQAIANFYELQVRKSNFSAERHHLRSQRFFYGMLGAQLGVIVATFAMAARKRNLLWSLAAGAGLLAVAFAIYVYLYI